VRTSRAKYIYIILFVGLLLVVAGRLIGLAYIYFAKVDMERISAYETVPGVVYLGVLLVPLALASLEWIRGDSPKIKLGLTLPYASAAIPVIDLWLFFSYPFLLAVDTLVMLTLVLCGRHLVRSVVSA